MNMQKMFKALGWVTIAGGVLGGILAYVIIGGQDFVVALLARVVEQPFEMRSNLALLCALVVAVVGALLGLVYLGLAEAMSRATDAE